MLNTNTETISMGSLRLIGFDRTNGTNIVGGCSYAGARWAQAGPLPAAEGARLVLPLPRQQWSGLSALAGRGGLAADALCLGVEGAALSGSCEVGSANVGQIACRINIGGDFGAQRVQIDAVEKNITGALGPVAKTEELPREAPSIEKITEALNVFMADPERMEAFAAAVVSNPDMVWLCAAASGNSVRSADGSYVTIYARDDIEHARPLGRFVYDKSGEEHRRLVDTAL